MPSWDWVGPSKNHHAGLRERHPLTASQAGFLDLVKDWCFHLQRRKPGLSKKESNYLFMHLSFHEGFDENL